MRLTAIVSQASHEDFPDVPGGLILRSDKCPSGRGIPAGLWCFARRRPLIHLRRNVFPWDGGDFRGFLRNDIRSGLFNRAVRNIRQRVRCVSRRYLLRFFRVFGIFCHTELPSCRSTVIVPRMFRPSAGGYAKVKSVNEAWMHSGTAQNQKPPSQICAGAFVVLSLETAQRRVFSAICASNAFPKLTRKSRVPSFVSWPASSNNPPLPPIYASGCPSTGMFRKLSDWRRW